MKHWTPEEIEFLQEKWGVWNVKAIAKNLGRTVRAVQMKAFLLGLGAMVTAYDGISAYELAKALNIHYQTIHRWINHHGLPAKRKVFLERPIWVVQIEDFWKWAEKNKHRVNFARLEENLLGPEPEWVKEKRKADVLGMRKIRKRPWTPEEDRRLKGLVHAHRYTYPEIAQILNRTEAAIMQRLIRLGIKARPVEMHRRKLWTEKEVKTLLELHKNGYEIQTIAERLGRSVFGCQSKLIELKKAK